MYKNARTKQWFRHTTRSKVAKSDIWSSTEPRYKVGEISAMAQEGRGQPIRFWNHDPLPKGPQCTDPGNRVIIRKKKNMKSAKTDKKVRLAMSTISESLAYDHGHAIECIRDVTNSKCDCGYFMLLQQWEDIVEFLNQEED